MKYKQILTFPVEHSGMRLAAQYHAPYLMFDVWNDDEIEGRYCIHAETGEYAYHDYSSGLWHQRKLEAVLEGSGAYYGYRIVGEAKKYLTKEDEEFCKKILECRYDTISWIDNMESRYCSDKRWEKEQRRYGRIRDLMNRIPQLPQDVEQWLFACVGDRHYLFKENKVFRCTSCQISWTEKEMKIFRDGKLSHNNVIECPSCGKKVTVKTRQKRILEKTACMVLQNIDQRMSVARHFDVVLEWNGSGRRTYLSESLRIILCREDPKNRCKIYYNQYPAEGGWNTDTSFDKANPSNRRTNAGYCYPGQISEALKGTWYEMWTRTFEQMAAAGIKAQYNRMMANTFRSVVNTVEYLFKGRFYRLLLETTERMEYWGSYYGMLNLLGESLPEVFGISDRQLINRIRDVNGGEAMVSWMRYSEETKKKIEQEMFVWLAENDLWPDDMPLVDIMSPRQVMNYVVRQQRESYPDKEARQIISQWKDYLSMCRRLNKDLSDEMVYRPRELKRRHDEAVEEINRIQMIKQMERNEEQRREQAEKMRQKFPGAEEVLHEIREKYEYWNDTYIITVPKSLMDIVTEGQALHHCAGASDRYFDRIMQRETYICFLRKASEPEIPYYTIEVEPGGTIRQHRGYLDEEPDIEKIKPFLREWQKELKKRLSRKDHEYAKISAVKRQENIDELKAKNNERVLRGLMEDFMEAV